MKTVRPLLYIILFSICFKLNGQTNEYLIKAGFIEKFANFTEWPNNSQNIFEIVVLGKSPFSSELETLYEGRKIKNKPVHIRYINSLSQIKFCDVLFICDSESSQITNILNYTANKPILTIGETNGFAKKGVHINFYKTSQGTIHFQINPRKVKNAGLNIDAMLLDYAIIIN